MKKVSVFVFSLLVIALFSVVAIAKEQDNANAADKPAKNMTNATYGQCVSEAAAVKKVCYADVKQTKESCIEAASNQTDSKNAVKTCKADYKKDKKQCKVDFKSVKKECKKIKHNFFETTRYAFA